MSPPPGNPRQARAVTGTTLAAAAGAGVIAGVIMVAAAIGYTAFATPLEALLPVKNVAATWLGVEALIGGDSTIALGVLTHIVTAAAWGGVFGLLGGCRLHPGAALALGTLVGILAWLAMSFFALPWLNPVMAARVDALPAWWWLTLHLLYGISLGIFAPLLSTPRQREALTAPRRPATA